MNSKLIKITDYGIDSGYGRVCASYDDGKPYEEIKSRSFDTVEDALAWVAEVVKEDETEINAHVAEPVKGIVNDYDYFDLASRLVRCRIEEIGGVK